MARYTGPLCRLCRRLGMKLFLKGDRCYTPKCAMDPKQRPYPPGPRLYRRRKISDYGVQLREKQKVRHMYGVLERQFRRYFAAARKRPGSTGETLLEILELRLDNVVYRFGFGDSRRQARQLVCHGHFLVDGHKTNIPSYILRPGQAICVRPQSQRLEYFKTLTEEIGRKDRPAWLNLDLNTLVGRVVSKPTKQDVDASINEQLIVEYYSR